MNDTILVMILSKIVIRKSKSAKLCALRAKNVLMCQCVLRAYVLTCQHVLRAHVLTCQRALRAHVLTCKRNLRAYLFTCQCALCTLVLMCLEWLRSSHVNVPRVLMYWRVNVAFELTCSRANMPWVPCTVCVTTWSPANMLCPLSK